MKRDRNQSILKEKVHKRSTRIINTTRSFVAEHIGKTRFEHIAQGGID